MDRPRSTTRLTWTAVALLVLLQAQLLPPRQPDNAAVQDAQTVQPNPTYGAVPLAFEPNRGQAGEGTDFLVHHGSAVTAFDGLAATTSAFGRSVTMSLRDAAQAPLLPTDKLSGTVNYLRGNNPAAWQQHIETYGRLTATDVYPGIDLSYYGTNSQLEHDFIVRPGADYRTIALSFSGQDSLELTAGGDLALHAGDQQLVLHAPTAYQLGAHEKHTVPSQFDLADDGSVRFLVADTYDPAKPLVIDPVLSLVYSTYFGGSGDDRTFRLKLDTLGNAYVTGQTDSTDLMTAAPLQASTAGGAHDAFVAKLSPDGQSLLYATYLGGSGDDYGYGVDVDASGNAYVATQTDSTDFPTMNPYQAANAGAVDSVVTKLDPSGGTIMYSTYLGGSQNDGPSDLVVSQDGFAYVSGFTQSSNYPLQNAYLSGFFNTMAFATKLSQDGQSLEYSTYLGGVTDTIDIAYCSALDDDGSLYLAGSTTTLGSNFPTVNAFQPSKAGGVWDMFVTKFAPSGQSLEYSTYLGGGGEDGAYIGCDVAVDDTGSAYVVGSTSSTDFPLSTPFQAAHAGGATYDGFLTKFSPDGQSLEYSTYLGGTDDDLGVSVAVDPSYHAHVLSTTRSADFPTKTPFQAANAGDHDASITKFTPDGQSLDYSTYFGSGSTDYASMIALDVNGDVYVTGYSDGGDIPLKNPIRATNPGGSDAFITQLTENAVTVTGIADALLTFSLGSTTCDLGHFSPTETKFCTHTMSVSTNATGGYVVSYIPTPTLTSGADTINAMASQTGSVSGTEQFGLNLAANTASGSNTASDFGAAPSGGTGAATGGYQTGDLFKFATGGESIAESSGPSLTTAFTASFIANVQLTTAPGTYTTPITYNVVANY